jgi:hypothetical protein
MDPHDTDLDDLYASEHLYASEPEEYLERTWAAEVDRACTKWLRRRGLLTDTVPVFCTPALAEWIRRNPDKVTVKPRKAAARQARARSSPASAIPTSPSESRDDSHLAELASNLPSPSSEPALPHPAASSVCSREQEAVATAEPGPFHTEHPTDNEHANL